MFNLASKLNKAKSLHKKTVYKLSQLPEFNDPLDLHIIDSTKRHYGHLKDVQIEVENLHIQRTPLEHFINSYRKYGHMYANIDPLKKIQRLENFANPLDFGLAYNKSIGDGNFKFDSSYIVDQVETVEQLEQQLQNIYAQSVGVEFDHLQSKYEKDWLYKNFEKYQSTPLSDTEKRNILTLLTQTEAFDHYLHKKFQTFKRYGGEGMETSITGLKALLAKASELGVEECVLAMPHRGRLNILTNILDYPPQHLFRKVKGFNDMPDEFYQGVDDVISHIAVSKTKRFIGMGCQDQPIHVSMMHNPSHLELINPSSLGKTRAKQDVKGRDKVLNIQFHGDAAFAAQGVVYENFAISQVPKFTIGGSVHIICNNQIGYTTSIKDSRGHFYCSDLAKMYSIPVIHVNSDDPEAVHRVCKFAVHYRQKFQKDIIIDVIGYRKYGHNELDEPSFTQPLYYEQIKKMQKSSPQLYNTKLVEDGVVKPEQFENMRSKVFEKLEDLFQKTSTEHGRPFSEYTNENSNAQKGFTHKWSDMKFSVLGKNDSEIPTGLKAQYLKNLGKQTVTIPNEFNIHPRLKKYFVEDRIKQIDSGLIDWATAEAISIASLLQQSYNIRFSGEDVERGTFSQRHWVFVDQKTEEEWNPLKDISEGMNKGDLHVCNSPLSESGVLSYEYGYSLESQNNLSMWEAQFGDFFNCAQTTFDTLILSSEEKWAKQSGLVCILPHGFDGAGPEHSSCKIERFLQQANTDSRVREFKYMERNPDRKSLQVGDQFFYENSQDANFSLVQPTTPANYYHVLRRQMLRNYRKPLIIAGPKTLLRHPQCKSTFEEMDENTFFTPVYSEFDLNISTKNILICSGKVRYVIRDLLKKENVTNTALLTVEELYPFPIEQIQSIFKNANLDQSNTKFIWVQEEPSNQGPYFFVEPHFERILGGLGFKNNIIEYVGRRSIATTATGVTQYHKQESQDINNEILKKIQ